MNTSASQPSNPALENHDDEIDLLALLWVLLSGWKIILAFAFLGLVLGVTYSRYVQPTYKTDALIQIDEKSKGLAALGSNISELVGSEASPAEAERELIKSRMVLEPVVNKLHLDIRVSNPEIGALDRIAQSQIPTQTSTTEGVFLETESGNVQISQFNVPRAYLNQPFTVMKTENGFKLSLDEMPENVTFKSQIGSKATFSSLEGDINITVNRLPADGQPITLKKLSTPAAINALNTSLSVSELGKQTGIVQLSMTGNNQQQITRVLESIVESYVDQNLERGSEQTTTTIKFMESQIPELKNKLEQSEQAFNKFREQYGTIDVSKEAELLLTESAQIKSQTSELNLKKAELLTYYTEEHPLVIQINDQLTSLNSRRQEIDNTITDLPEIQREFVKLSEDMAINREIYLTMLKNYEQLKIARAGEIGYVRVVDMPINTFDVIAPRKLVIWAISLILGTLLGSLLVLIKSLLRNTIKDPDQLEAKTGIPVIATIPRSKAVHRLVKNKKTAGDHLLTMVDHDGLSYEGIKSLRTFLMFGMPKTSKLANNESHKGKVILITGESPNIGKSFISANLTETFSQLNKKILLIDGDMRLGELHHTFPVNEDKGLADYLSNKQDKNIIENNKDGDINVLSDYIHPTSFDNVDLLPRGRQPHNPSSLLSSDRFEQLMIQLIAYYDHIIIDSPPVLAASDAIIMAQYADQVLLVTRYNQSIEGQANYAIKQLQKANVAVNGIVLNDMVQGMTDKYSYHYNYAYGNNSSNN